MGFLIVVVIIVYLHSALLQTAGWMIKSSNGHIWLQHFQTIFPGCDQPLIGHNVHDLCPDTITKVGYAWHIAAEAQALDFV
jgi:hypothetical protein